MKVFTLGYQGLGLDLYTETLTTAGVGVLIDVRETPWSYNRRYIKSVLERTMVAAEIDYVHLRECGNPSANRKSAVSVKDCLAKYRRYLRKNSDCLITLLDHVRIADDTGRPACLTCYEREPHDCHRSILLEFLAKADPSLEINHLRVLPETPIRTASAQRLFSDTKAQLL